MSECKDLIKQLKKAQSEIKRLQKHIADQDAVIISQIKIIESQRKDRNYYRPFSMVYFAYSPKLQLIKIGMTTQDIKFRLKDHRAHVQDPNVEIIYWIEGDHAVEHYIHKTLRQHRRMLGLSFEWFEYAPVLQYIKEQYGEEIQLPKLQGGK